MKTTEEIWACERCKITHQNKKQMCPCPRAGCEAEVVGQKVNIITIELYNNGKPCKHPVKKSRFDGLPYCKVFKGKCKCKE